MIDTFTMRKWALGAILLCVTSYTTHAENYFLPLSGDWTNAANWTDGIVPTNSADVTDGSTAIYTGGGPVAAGHIFIGDSASGSLTFNSGSLTNTAGFGDFGFNVGIFAGGSGFFTMNAGTLSVVPFVIARDGGSGTVVQNGGTVLVNDFFAMG